MGGRLGVGGLLTQKYQELVEYVLMLTVIVIAMIVVLGVPGTDVFGVFLQVQTALADH